MFDTQINNDADLHASSGNGTKEPADSPAATEPDSGNHDQEESSRATVNRTTLSSTKPVLDDWDRDLISEPPRQGLWHGVSGLAVMTFGVVLPAVLLVLGCASIPKRITLVLLSHPIETLIEIALLFSIPVVNYAVWRALRSSYIPFSRLRDYALGVAICASAIVSAVCAAGLIVGSKELLSDVGTAFATGFAFMAGVALLAGITAGYLANRVRLTRDLPRARARVVGSVVSGAVLCLLTFIAAEARPWCVRIAQRQAVSNTRVERQHGLGWLRSLNPERELRMECADARAAGLVGLFIPLKSSTQHQLYFALTGKPYSFRDSHNNDLTSMPDDYLSRHVVGEKIEGLSLCRSKLDGTIHPNSLSSTVHWTMVFKNDSSIPQEVRAELKVPQGAVITGLRQWNNGEAHDGIFAASNKGPGVSTWVEAGHYSPAIITDLGRNRVLMHCYPVPQEEELKVQVTMVVPLKPDGSQTAAAVLPRFIASNFDLSGENQLRLRSQTKLSSGIKGLKASTTPVGEKLLFGDLQADQLSGSDLVVEAVRSNKPQTIAVLDKLAVRMQHDEVKRKEEARLAQSADSSHSQQVVVMIDGSKGVQRQLEDVARVMARKNSPHAKPMRVKTIPPRYVVQSVKQIASPAPSHIVVVVDGSTTIAPYREALCKALEKLPSTIPASLIIATQEGGKLMEPVALSKGLEKLRQVQFVGGQDNLHAVVKAAELAGENAGGAVLWVHGPQPVLNREIYIMAPYAAAPAFYELPLDSGDADTVEFFKNHSEIGPFSDVPRNAALSADLARFFSRWNADSHDYTVALSESTSTSADVARVTDQEARELIALNANQKCLRLLSERKTAQAMKLAVAYGLVTPVSSAMVLDPTRAASAVQDGAYSTGSDASSPELQGAVNGTIVQGVNTSGTVRVNNLANLEALLNIIANLLEVGCMLAGGAIVLHGLINRTTVEQVLGIQASLTPSLRVAIGAGLVMLGLAAPGIINWFVASARDANLFS